MADIDTSGGGGKKKGGVKKGKKLSTRVDLTPMVDLGFLLITFFIFTTTMSKPKTMEINMPYKYEKTPVDNTEVKESTALTILLSKDHRVYYYEGIGSQDNPPQVKLTSFKTPDGIRDVIIDKKKRVEDMVRSGASGLKSGDAIVVMIKPDDNSTYDDFVSIIDEMAINGVKKYAVVDITEVDKGFIDMTEAANGEQ
jgi:biopolymer transport protein ExbD